MNDFTPRVTAKQVAMDAVTLAKDTGVFLIDLVRLIYSKITKPKPEKTPDNQPA